jgi:hypothetical protein
MRHGICDADTLSCIPRDFTCNGSVLNITGTEFSYDCANNKELDGNLKDDILCNTYYGCSDNACVGDDLKSCVDTGCDVIEHCDPGKCSDQALACVVCDPDAIECSIDEETGLAVAKMCMYGQEWVEDTCFKGWACDAEKGGCYNADPCTEGGSGICTGADNKTYKYCNANTKAWEATVCVADCDPDSGCGTCGDTFKQDYEVCDKNNEDTIYKTCEQAFGRDYKWTGKPGCNDTCSGFVTGTCTHKPEVQIDSWTISDLASMKRNKQIDLNGGMTTSEAVDGGWRVGPWGNAKSPDFNNRYISFISSKADSSVYDTLIFSFKVKRNDKGPKALKVAFYDGDTKFFESKEIIITNDEVLQSVSKLDPNSKGKISVRGSAYESVEASTGTMTISGMELKGTMK